MPPARCGCFTLSGDYLVRAQYLGMDEHFAEVTLLICSKCGQHWLRYAFEMEAFSRSGRWYLGAITPEQASHLTASNAKTTLEGLSWYYFGGSFFAGRTGKTAGRIFLYP